MKRDAFVSYSRTDRTPFIQELVNDIRLFVATAWYDGELADKGGQLWWDIICRNIRECDIFVAVLTNSYLNSVPCRAELKYAQELKRTVLPVSIVGEELDSARVPTVLQRPQYVTFERGKKTHLLDLKESIAGIAHSPGLPSPLPEQPPVPYHPVSVLREQLGRLEVDYVSQRGLLDQLRGTLENEKYSNKAIEFLHEFCEREDILVASIWKEAQSLRDQVSPVKAGPDVPESSEPVRPRSRSGIEVQISEWCKTLLEILGTPFDLIFVPKSSFKDNAMSRTVDRWGGEKYEVGAKKTIGPFAVGKYPITNAQFRVFLKAEDGYRNSEWWGYSPESENWFEENKTPAPQHSKSKIVPRTNVSWYAAQAFCLWLTKRSGLEVALPTSDEWQYAAQMTRNGREERVYPWGDEFFPTRCNYRSERLKDVTHFDKGATDLGVMDMSGNASEWCYDKANSPLKGHRIIRGGSFLSRDSYELQVTRSESEAAIECGKDIGFRILVKNAGKRQ